MLPRALISTRATSICVFPSVSTTSMLRSAFQQGSRPFSRSMQTSCCTSRSSFKKPQNSISQRNTRSATTSSVSASSSPSIPTPPQALTWNDYLSLRQKRRYYNLGSSIITGLATLTGGASFLMTQDLEKLSSVLFGLDPVMALGLASLAFGAVGWLTGPFAGEAVFRLMHRRVIRQMEVKEKDFYHRIKKNRCDPSAQSVSNPVPDYYGEKISSVQGYRQWLKDQRAFRKKREIPTI